MKGKSILLKIIELQCHLAMRPGFGRGKKRKDVGEISVSGHDGFYDKLIENIKCLDLPEKSKDSLLALAILGAGKDLKTREYYFTKILDVCEYLLERGSGQDEIKKRNPARNRANYPRQN